MSATNGTKLHVWTLDPAIDAPTPAARAEIAARVNSGKAAATDIPLRQGHRLVLWQIRSLTCRGYADLARVAHSETLRRLAGAENASALLGRSLVPEQIDAFRRGVVSVDGASGIALDKEAFEDAPGAQRVLKSEMLDQVMATFGGLLLQEIGQRILDETEVNPSTGRG